MFPSGLRLNDFVLVVEHWSIISTTFRPLHIVLPKKQIVISLTVFATIRDKNWSDYNFQPRIFMIFKEKACFSLLYRSVKSNSVIIAMISQEKLSVFNTHLQSKSQAAPKHQLIVRKFELLTLLLISGFKLS